MQVFSKTVSDIIIVPCLVLFLHLNGSDSVSLDAVPFRYIFVCLVKQRLSVLCLILT